MAKGGCCIGPPGARIHHERCTWPGCTCECYEKERNEAA